ncbi:hypothetical protein [Nitratifractor sp.]
MRRIFTLLFLLLLGGSLYASDWLSDYEDALEQAQKGDKLIMMMYVKKG